MNIVKKLFLVIVFVITGCVNFTNTETIHQLHSSPSTNRLLPITELQNRFDSGMVGITWSSKDYIVIIGSKINQIPIFIINMKDNSIIPLKTNDLSINPFLPAKISPNEEYIVYRIENGGFEISKLDDLLKTGFTKRKYYIDMQQGALIDWRQDSQKLAILKYSENNRFSLYLYSLTDMSLKKVYEFFEPYDGRVYLGDEMSWSSDGNKIAFSLEYSDSNGSKKYQSDLFIFDLSSNNLTKVTFTENKSELYPSWNPNGILMFVTVNGNINSGITNGQLTFSTSEGNCINIFSNYQGVSYPSWSPDGQQIAFVSKFGLEMLDVSIIPSRFLSTESLCN
jgi:Tol biopolymer transport system component